MNIHKFKWLRLELQNDEVLASKYSIIHTHFSMYSYLLEQGSVLGIFQPVNYEKDMPNGVIYIQTNHQGFYDSCFTNYAYDFKISEMSPYFIPPSNYKLMLGAGITLKNAASY